MFKIEGIGHFAVENLLLEDNLQEGVLRARIVAPACCHIELSPLNFIGEDCVLNNSYTL